MSSTGHDSNAPLEKDFSQRNGGYTNGNGSQHLHENMDPDTALKRIRTAGSISISPELFEKMYLSPQNQVKGDLRKTFGNPTPLALAGFLLCLSPLSADLMGWRGAGGNGAASTGVYYFFGGIMMMLGGFLEFILGNTFPFVVFMSFGAFWLSFGATLQPFYNAYGAYSTTGVVAEGLETVGFNSSFAFFLVFMGVLCLVYFVCSLRTNLIFALIFLFLIPAFGCLSGAFWQGANAYAAAAAGDLAASAQHAETAHRCQTAGGALAFVVCMLGWYLFFGIMLAALDFPFQLPVFDLSHIITGASEKANRRQENIDNLEPSA